MTLFEKIIAREIPAEVVYEDEQLICFKDINPQAPIHVLIVPKKAITRVSEADSGDLPLLGQLLIKAGEIAAQLRVAESGFRLVINNGAGAGETVPHLHLHLLGGRPMKWPPG